VTYFGRERKGGSAYGVCLDCADNKGDFQVIDGHNSSLSDDNAAPSVVLFSVQDLDPTATHTLDITNLPDNRFAKTGTITFDFVIVGISDKGATSSPPRPGVTRTASHPAATTASPAATSSAQPTASSTATSSTSSHPAASPSATSGQLNSNAGSGKSKFSPKAVIVIISVFSILAVLGIAVFVFFYLRRRKQRQGPPDLERDPEINERTPLNVSSPIWGPKAEAREVTPHDSTPDRPKNPNEGLSAPNVPLDEGISLGVPASSSLMQRRMEPRPQTRSDRMPWLSRRIA
jgi:hypothetical protein